MHAAIASEKVSLAFMYPWVWVKETSLVIYHTHMHTHTFKYNLCPRSLPSAVLYIHPLAPQQTRLLLFRCVCPLILLHADS